MGYGEEVGSTSRGLSIPAEAAADSAPLLPPGPSAPARLSSLPKTLANVFIAIVGAGVLGLPYTFKRTGWVAGSLMIAAVSALIFHSMMLLVRTRRKLERDGGCSKIASFGDLGYAVSGATGRLAVDAMIVLSQAGFCASYLIFIANTLAHIAAGSSSATVLGLRPKTVCIWGMLPFQLGLNSVRTLTHLAPLSIFADVVDVGAMGAVMAEDVVLFLRRRPPVRALGGLSAVSYGLGVAVYAFEGIGMVLPLEAEAADEGKFGGVLGASMLVISLTYILFGNLGYFAFGEETRDIITTNLGGGLLTEVVRLGLCVNLFFTFPLMMNPVHELLERRLAGKRFSLWLRWAAVLAVALVALLVPNFTDFLALVGSSVCSLLAFVLPSWFHLRVFKREIGLAALLVDLGLVALGVALAVTGTWTSLAEILSVSS